MKQRIMIIALAVLFASTSCVAARTRKIVRDEVKFTGILALALGLVTPQRADLYYAPNVASGVLTLHKTFIAANLLNMLEYDTYQKFQSPPNSLQEAYLEFAPTIAWNVANYLFGCVMRYIVAEKIIPYFWSTRWCADHWLVGTVFALASWGLFYSVIRCHASDDNFSLAYDTILFENHLKLETFKQIVENKHPYDLYPHLLRKTLYENKHFPRTQREYAILLACLKY